MTARRSYKGAAATLTLAADITSTSLSITTTGTVTGWPDGSGGKFLAVIGRGTANEEKFYVLSRSGNTLTISAVGDRGADDTSATSHSSGVFIEHCVGADDLDEANAHIALTAQDDHTQYLNTTRHDTVARHAIANLPTGTTSVTVALGNHVHSATLGYTEKTATNQTGISSVTDLTGLSAAVTVAAGRRVKITAVVFLTQKTGNGGPVLYIREGGTTLQQVFTPANTNVTTSPVAMCVLTPSTGAHTYKLSAAASANTVDTNYDPTTPSFILVEDIGT